MTEKYTGYDNASIDNPRGVEILSSTHRTRSSMQRDKYFFKQVITSEFKSPSFNYLTSIPWVSVVFPRYTFHL